MRDIARFLSQRIFWVTAILSILFSSVKVVNAAEGKLQNPSLFGNIPDFIAGVLKAIVTIGLPIITLFIVISGFMFLIAQGNPTKIETAKKNFMWVIVGTLLILGAWVLVTLIAGTVTQLVGKT